jgi:urease accessory protein
VTIALAAAAPPRAAVTIAAERRGARTVLRRLAGTEPWHPRPLAPAAGGVARVALVQSRASILGGDEVVLEVALGPGARLELVELGATVAHHARDRGPARLDVALDLAGDAALVWSAQPLVAAAGCALERRCLVTLAAGARALLRDTLVLGRAREEPGAVRSRLRALHDGRPLLDEELDTTRALRSPVVAGGARVLDGLTLLGVADPEPPRNVMTLARPGALWRGAGDDAAALERAAAPLAERWRALTLG